MKLLRDGGLVLLGGVLFAFAWGLSMVYADHVVILRACARAPQLCVVAPPEQPQSKKE